MISGNFRARTLFGRRCLMNEMNLSSDAFLMHAHICSVSIANILDLKKETFLKTEEEKNDEKLKKNERRGSFYKSPLRNLWWGCCSKIIFQKFEKGP
jgi:hypothetical protein